MSLGSNHGATVLHGKIERRKGALDLIRAVKKKRKTGREEMTEYAWAKK